MFFSVHHEVMVLGMRTYHHLQIKPSQATQQHFECEISVIVYLGYKIVVVLFHDCQTLKKSWEDYNCVTKVFTKQSMYVACKNSNFSQ